jgi:hypothetical protein
LIVIALCTGCEKPNSTPVADTSLRKPTATEVFNLQSKCAELAKEIDGEYDLTGQEVARVTNHLSFLRQEPFSHYNPRTNRCYVELRVTVKPAVFPMAASNTEARKFLETFEPSFEVRQLYDGQTGEELAFGYTGMKSRPELGYITERGKVQWSEASIMIDGLMNDDRKQ